MDLHAQSANFDTNVHRNSHLTLGTIDTKTDGDHESHGMNEKPSISKTVQEAEIFKKTQELQTINNEKLNK
jgi:hypothetical protein